MKLFFAGLLIAAGVFAQTAPTLTLSTTSPVYPGAPLSVAVNLSGAAGANLAGIGITVPAGSSALVIGDAGAKAAKAVYSLDPPAVVVVIASEDAPNATAIADGTLVTFNYAVPTNAPYGPLQLALTAPLGASADGNAVALAAPPLALTVTLSPSCRDSVKTALATYLVNPSIALLGQIVSDLASPASCKGR